MFEPVYSAQYGKPSNIRFSKDEVRGGSGEQEALWRTRLGRRVENSGAGRLCRCRVDVDDHDELLDLACARLGPRTAAPSAAVTVARRSQRRASHQYAYAGATAPAYDAPAASTSASPSANPTQCVVLYILTWSTLTRTHLGAVVLQYAAGLVSSRSDRRLRGHQHQPPRRRRCPRCWPTSPTCSRIWSGVSPR
jgi:hypothetical protein